MYRNSKHISTSLQHCTMYTVNTASATAVQTCIGCLGLGGDGGTSVVEGGSVRCENLD